MMDTKDLRRLAQAALAGPDGISLNWIKLLQDFQQKTSPAAVIEILNRLESAEKERDNANAAAAGIALQAETLQAERDALRAEVQTWQGQAKAYWSKITEMEKQEPYSYIYEYANPIDGSPVWRNVPGFWNAQFPKSSIPLYLAPGAQAQPAPSAPEVTDAMALAFHSALTDGSIGEHEMEEIKAGLRAALSAAPEAKP